MNFGGMGNMMGAVPGGFIAGQQGMNQVEQGNLSIIKERATQAGMQAYFRALQSMMGGGQGQGPQPPMPGQPSMPGQQAGPSISPNAMPGQPMAMGPQGPTQPDAQGVHPASATLQAPGGGAWPPMEMQSAQASGGGPSSAPGGPPGVPQQPNVPPVSGGAPGGQPQLSWQNIVRAVKQANPGMDDMALASAVDHFMPMMNQQMQMDWRDKRNQLMLDLGIIKADTSKTNADTRAAATTDAASTRAAATTDAATTRAGGQVDAAGIRAAEVAANREQRASQFAEREARLERSLGLRADQGWARLDQQKQALEQRIRSGDRRQAVVEWRAALDAQHKMAQEKINITSINNAMKPPEKKKLMDDQAAWYRDQIEKLNNLTTQRGNVTDSGVETGRQVVDVPAGQPLPGAKPTAPAQSATPAAAPTGQAVPQAFAADPDGTKYQKGGQTWVKRGNQLVMEPVGPQSMSDEQPDPIQPGQKFAANTPPSGNVRPLTILGSGNTKWVQRPDGRWVQHDDFGPVGLMPAGFDPRRTAGQ